MRGLNFQFKKKKKKFETKIVLENLKDFLRITILSKFS